MDGEDQPAASQMSTQLDHAQEEAMPLVEWALTPMGHRDPTEEYANVIASTNPAFLKLWGAPHWWGIET